MEHHKLIKLSNLKEGEKPYVTYFYNKNIIDVYKVTTNGSRCAIVIAEQFDIPKFFKSGSSLPKYITKGLPKNDRKDSFLQLTKINQERFEIHKELFDNLDDVVDEKIMASLIEGFCVSDVLRLKMMEYAEAFHERMTQNEVKR